MITTNDILKILESYECSTWEDEDGRGSKLVDLLYTNKADPKNPKYELWNLAKFIEIELSNLNELSYQNGLHAIGSIRDIMDDPEGKLMLGELVLKIAKLKESRQWLPIKTAPKDGTTVLVPVHETAFYDIDYERWMKPYTDLIILPTHWMPLPEPPKE